MDDEEVVRNTLSAVLKMFGHEVTLAEKGEEAIDLYRQAKVSGKPFDLVILDLTIRGGMGGRETIARLRGIDPEVKAIVSSGYSNDPILSDYVSYGFIGKVTKPFKVVLLHNELVRILAGN